MKPNRWHVGGQRLEQLLHVPRYTANTIQYIITVRVVIYRKCPIVKLLIKAQPVIHFICWNIQNFDNLFVCMHFSCMYLALISDGWTSSHNWCCKVHCGLTTSRFSLQYLLCFTNSKSDVHIWRFSTVFRKFSKCGQSTVLAVFGCTFFAICVCGPLPIYITRLIIV